MQVVISDSSVIIDLARAGLIEAAFALPYDFRIPDVMFDDELLYLGDYSRDDLIKAGLTKSTLDGSGVEMALRFGKRYLALSTNDRFALALARIESAALLSGDHKLCDAAEQENLTTLDLLWLIDELIAQGTLGNSVLREALDILTDDPHVGLPKSELQRRIRALS